ncbi:MAG: hypothetical protein ACRDPC_27460 [Solirubrobacteraceae bacterium]
MRTPTTPTCSPARRQLARRAAVVLAAGLTLAIAAGCGSGSERAGRPPGGTTASTPTSRGPQHTAQQVADHFHAVTGDTLRIEPHEVTWDTLTLASDNSYQLNDRYGIFTIAVLHSAQNGEVFKSDDGRPLQPDANGIYWSQGPDGGWNANKFYGNVVLSWSADRHAVDAAFKRLDAILSTVGQPAATVRAKLPAGDQPCQARGITLAGRTEGTCRDGDVTLTIVNRGHALKLPGYTISVALTKSGNLIKPDNPYEPTMRAKGEFVGVGLRVANTGNIPLEGGLYDAQLRIGDRYYEQDSGVSFRLSDPDTFPLQPGEQGTTMLVFDVPAAAARNALSQGAIVLPAERHSDVQDATKLGASRLAPIKPSQPPVSSQNNATTA